MKQKLLFLFSLFLLITTGRAAAQQEDIYPEVYQVIACSDSSFIDIFAGHPQEAEIKALDLTAFSATSLKQRGKVYFNEDRVLVYFHEEIGAPDQISYTVDGSGLGTLTQNLFVVDCPDNIDVAVCVDKPVGFEFRITEDWKGSDIDVATYLSPIIGDLDNDGMSEIVVAKYIGNSFTTFRQFEGLYVYEGKYRATNKKATIFIDTPVSNYMPAGHIAMARVKNIPLIVLLAGDGHLYAYNPYNMDPQTTGSGHNYIWKSDVQVALNYSQNTFYGSVAFADFNNDGFAEIYVGNRIFDAANGELLVDGEGGTKGASLAYNNGNYQSYQYMPAVSDINGDGTLEFIGGTKIYTVDIDAGTMEEYFDIGTITIGGTYNIVDGLTMLADFNKDGYLDVMIRTIFNTSTFGIAIWDIKNQKILAANSFSNNGGNCFGGIPFIGDVDADGDLEIMNVIVNSLKGYRWDGVGTIKEVYTLDVVDSSGSTGITLFDFNQSGKAQLVYRDQANLRILSAVPGVGGSVGTFSDEATISGVTSGTYFESAVVADVDNDGAAEIITTGGDSGVPTTGTLRIYKSGNSFSWAPARKVWNQYSYNVVNINDDLTVPQYRMNQARIFSYNEDGTPHQPYNNSLQQQTILDQNGNPFRPLPYAVWTSEPTYTRANDQITITASIANKGDVDLNTPIVIVAYREEIDPDNWIGIFNFEQVLKPGDEEEITATFDLDDTDSTSKIVITVNDDGTGQTEQDQCNVVSQNIIYFVQALDDHLIKDGTPAEVTVDILVNDFLGKHPTEDRYITLDDEMHTFELAGDLSYPTGTEPQYGTIELVEDKVIYTPDDPESFPGRDTFTYRLTVDDDVTTLSSEATVIIEFIKAEDNSYALSDYTKLEMDLVEDDFLLRDPAELTEADPDRVVTIFLPDDNNNLQAPALGTVALDPDDETKVIYTPGRKDGLDIFEYQIAYENPNAIVDDESTYYVTSTGTVYIWVLNEDRITCIEEEAITLEVPDGAVFTWYDAETDGNELETLNDNVTLLVEKPDDEVFKEQWVSMSYKPDGVNDLFEDKRIKVRVRFQPVHMYWNQAATNNDWNDVANWTDEEGDVFDPSLEFIPSECTIVHIPGNATSYPVLDDIQTDRTTYGDPTCDQIIFHFGGEVARPELLTYNRAFIHYNVGYYNNDGDLVNADPLSAEPMKRDRWYALATPLKKVATGDFSFGGWPNTWQMSFIQNTGSSSDWIGEFSVPFNTNSVELGNSAAYSLAFWANGYSTDRGSSNQSGLDAVKGIIELPYHENTTASNAHRIHSYNPASKVSSFQYYYWQIDGSPLASAAEKPFGTINRGSNNEAYRFVIDGNVNAFGVFNINTVTASSEVMIGNPIMSTLDFNALYDANTARMENYYRIYNGSTFDTYSIATGGAELDKNIAPLQAFFITTKQSGTINLQFPLDKVSVTNPGTSGKLRSSTTGGDNAKPDVLYVTSESGRKTSSATLAFLNIGEENVPALFYPDAVDVAQMYFIGESEKRNVIQYASYGEELRFGYHKESPGQVKLSFRNLEQVNAASLLLTDQWTGKEQDLLADPVYTFESTGSSFTDRFLLKVGERTNNPTGNDGIGGSSWEVRISHQDSHFIVRSNHLIDQIRVYDLQGVLRSVRENISADYYAYPLSGHGVCIVKITAAGGQEKVCKVTY